jgi:hypothetical protein
VTERFLARKGNSRTSSGGGATWVTAGDLVGDADVEQTFVEGQVCEEVECEAFMLRRIAPRKTVTDWKLGASVTTIAICSWSSC